MRIEWLDGVKEVPRIGIVVEGQEYTVPDDIGKNLIKFNKAKEVKEAKTKTTTKKEVSE